MEEKTTPGVEYTPQYPGRPGPKDPRPKDPDCHEECQCECGKHQNVTFGLCEEFKEITVQNVKLQCEGRFLRVKVELNNVCAGRKVNIGVIVSEEKGGTTKTKGFRATELTIPGHHGTCMQSIAVGDFCFVFPETNLCSQRKFKVNVIAHYTSLTHLNICSN
ncbi:MAG: hypothetical protein GX334_04125 [Firmicutes bacterium]|nr:hypothetical protein [Bacillota bacterium]